LPLKSEIVTEERPLYISLPIVSYGKKLVVPLQVYDAPILEGVVKFILFTKFKFVSSSLKNT
jgi:hypothetical protein